jgi:murein DD-endopeptidase MepM/ murein hydrolase activator NlpD
MSRTTLTACLGCILFGAVAYAQEVMIPRDASSDRTAAQPVKQNFPTALPMKEKPAIAQSVKPQLHETESVSVKITLEQMRKAGALAAEKEKMEARVNQPVQIASRSAQVRRQEPVASRLLSAQTRELEAIRSQPVNNQIETAFTKLADGFDFPIGKPDAQGYYKARGFRSHGHLGEDWDGIRGGDTDLGDAIYSIGDGVVVFARDCHMGWGNVIIVRHSYREGGTVKNIDALYGHLNGMFVNRGQAVTRGQKIATMGTAHGLYDAHLHLEIRKNIEIGMSRAAFARDFSNYYDPSQFIVSHRHLQTSGGTYRVAMNTFVRDAAINFDKARNYSHSHYRGGSSESAAALKKAVASGQ